MPKGWAPRLSMMRGSRFATRCMGMSRVTAKKYALAENPPTKRFSAKERAKAEALAASLTATD